MSTGSATSTVRAAQAPARFPFTSVLGVPFHNLRMEAALNAIEQFVAERTPRQVCLSNAYTVSLACRDPELLSVLRHSDLVLADGMSIVWGARWVGLNIPERVAGPDLMGKLCERSAAKKFRIFLMGSTPENLARLHATLLERWPGLIITGCHSPSMAERFTSHENEAIVAEVRRAQPDILFVGMSCPKQERWIAEHLEQLQVPVSLGVGAAFDFLSGRVPRAPARLQKVGLEWLFRLWCEPRRLWRRYLLGNAVFLSALIAQGTRTKLSDLFPGRSPHD